MKGKEVSPTAKRVTSLIVIMGGFVFASFLEQASKDPNNLRMFWINLIPLIAIFLALLLSLYVYNKSIVMKIFVCSFGITFIFGVAKSSNLVNFFHCVFLFLGAFWAVPFSASLRSFLKSSLY